MAEMTLRTTTLPWSGEPGEAGRLALALALMLLIFLPLAILVPRIQLPEPDRAEVERVPPQLARLLAPQPEPVVAPRPEPRPERDVATEPDPEPEPASKPQPKPEARPEPERKPPEPAPEPRQTAKAPPTRQTVKEARAVASKSGLMAMQDQLAAMREDSAPAAAPVQANVTEAGAAEPGPQAQSVFKGSGGVDTRDGPARDVKLADHTVASVAAPEPVAKAPAPKPAAHKSGPSQRAMSNIRQVFNRQKTALYALYNRELRKDPTLAGKVLLELVIEPDGTVSRCDVIESELDRPRLEQNIANRVRLFNFGKANVETRTVRFPIDFLPS